MAEIGDVVRVNTEVLDSGISPGLHGRSLLVTTDGGGVLDAGGRGKARIYSSLREVQADWPPTSEAYKAAVAYFGQSGPRELSVGYWAQQSAPTTITGGTPDSVTRLRQIDSGSFILGDIEFTPINFGSRRITAVGIGAGGFGIANEDGVVGVGSRELRVTPQGGGVPAVLSLTLDADGVITEATLEDGGRAGGLGFGDSPSAVQVPSSRTAFMAVTSSSPATIVTGGSGTGAAVTAATVNGNGSITGVTWATGSAGYAQGDVLTFTQGQAVGTYALESGDVSSGALQALSSVVIGGGAAGSITLTATAINSYVAIANALQSVLRTVGDTRFTNVMVAYTSSPSRFTVTFPGGEDVGGVFQRGTVGIMTLADSLGLSADGFGENDGANYSGGGMADTNPSDALAEIANVGLPFTYIFVESAMHSNFAHMESVADWVNANKEYMFFAGVNGSQALQTGEEVSVAARLAAKGYEGTVVCWSEGPDYQSASVAGFYSSINFDQPNSIATINLKDLPGFTPAVLSSTQRAELRRKRVNYLDSIIGLNTYREGWTADERLFADSQAWIIWMENQVEIAVFSLLRGSPAVPLTAAGIDTLKFTVERTLEKGVRNGGIAPGTASPAMRQDIRRTTGDEAFDGMLTKGYKVHIGSIADQSQVDRAARMAPPIKTWIKSSGAIHMATITLVWEA